MKEMKELIERLRRVAGSEEGQWDPVYNNAADALEAQAKQIEELERQLANEKAKMIHSCHDDCNRDGCVNRRLREQLAAAQKDAERYRWLRNQTWDNSPMCVVPEPWKAVKLGYDTLSFCRLDNAIDAAMQAQQGEKK